MQKSNNKKVIAAGNHCVNYSSAINALISLFRQSLVSGALSDFFMFFFGTGSEQRSLDRETTCFFLRLASLLDTVHLARFGRAYGAPPALLNETIKFFISMRALSLRLTLRIRRSLI
jgi:hypothetical protein